MSKIIKSIELRYINEYQNSNKFYIISLYDNLNVTIRWGRIGTNGRVQTKKHQFLWSAENYYQQKRKEKEKKDYYLHQINNYDPEDSVIENKQVELQITNSNISKSLDIWDAEF